MGPVPGSFAANSSPWYYFGRAHSTTPHLLPPQVPGTSRSPKADPQPPYRLQPYQAPEKAYVAPHPISPSSQAISDFQEAIGKEPERWWRREFGMRLGSAIALSFGRRGSRNRPSLRWRCRRRLGRIERQEGHRGCALGGFPIGGLGRLRCLDRFRCLR